MKSLRLAAAGAVAAWAGAANAEPPPASAFGRIGAVVEAVISPDGRRVAMLGGVSDQRIISIATLDEPGLPILQLGDVEAIGLQWAGDEFVLAQLAYWEKTGPRAAYRLERNVTVTLEGKAVARLFENDPVSSLLTEQQVVGITNGAPPRAMAVGLIESSGPSSNMNTKLQRKGFESPYVTALYSVDPATGRGKLIERGDYDTQGWEVDAEGAPRVRLEIDELNHRFTVSGRPKGKGGWSAVYQGADFESRRFYHGYSVPDEGVYLGLDNKLVLKRLADGAVSVLADGSANGQPSLVWDEHRMTAVGVRTGLEKPVFNWLDPQVGAAHATLAKVFSGKSVALWNWSADRQRFVARVSSPSAPGAWYLFDSARKEVSPLGEEYPELAGVRLGPTRWITYKARDGLEIPAYVTTPPDHVAGTKAPLIVLPHGGPTSRDNYDFDYLAQFLASRGYVVLQPQFRGSWGFGSAFEKAGLGEWGGKMQTDLLDGVQALATEGLIDPARVCVVGASFGGYAALAGVSLHPEAYRCAVSIAGIGDLGQLIVEKGRLYGLQSGSLGELKVALGQATPDKLTATSPARQAAHVRAPVLLIHGTEDTVVLPDQSRTMANALKAAGKPYELLLLDGENHYLTRSKTRTQVLEATEAFLAKHLPVG
ncbi:MAG TPA: S9 family peptidase [Phenylobacterium sp.]|uniref:alpha/beta hydrolase family protein n=1 Tax=Phenylobacterium sp. TaxID=1871053 RepID=UPI002F91EAF5